MIISMNKNNPAVFEPYKINIETGELKKLFENNDIQNPINGYTFDKNGILRAYVKLRGVLRMTFIMPPVTTNLKNQRAQLERNLWNCRIQLCK